VLQRLFSDERQLTGLQAVDSTNDEGTGIQTIDRYESVALGPREIRCIPQMAEYGVDRSTPLSHCRARCRRDDILDFFMGSILSHSCSIYRQLCT